MVGKGVKISPLQISFTGVNSGFTFWFTLIIRVAGFAHSPTSGVNIYKLVIVLSSVGLQVPVIPSLDVVGKGAKEPPLQMSPTGVNRGSTFWFTKMVSVVGFAHSVGLGVNV